MQLDYMVNINSYNQYNLYKQKALLDCFHEYNDPVTIFFSESLINILFLCKYYFMLINLSRKSIFQISSFFRTSSY
jgi:hypothetical protein